MEEIATWSNGNRTATLLQNKGSLTGNHYVVELKIDGRLFQKQHAYSLGSAENLAEEFISIVPGPVGSPRLLNENGER